MKPITVVVPVLGRPQNAAPFVESLAGALSSNLVQEVMVVVDLHDEPTAVAWYEIPPGDVAITVLRTDTGHFTAKGWERPRPGTFAEKANYAYRFIRTEWMFLVGDDVRFHDDWASIALGAAVGTKACVIGTNDLANPRTMQGEHSTHTFVRTDYARDPGASWDGPGTVCSEAYHHWYCNPPTAPIWMADLSFKSLGDVRVGDEVIGWERGESGRFTLNRLRTSTVLALSERTSSLVNVKMESGRAFTCTPDHRWLNAGWSPSSSPGVDEWVQPNVGRSLLHVVDEPAPLDPEQEWLAGWLAGIYDGEGSWIQIAQCPVASPEVFAAIEAALNKLDIPHTVGGPTPGGYFFCLTGKRQAYVDFINRCRPVKRSGIIKKIVGGQRFGQRDRVAAVEPAGTGRVISMTTETGNYVAWGYASRNCDDELITIAKMRDVWVHATGSIVEHRHPYFTPGVEWDETYALGESRAAEDQATWLERVRKFAPELISPEEGTDDPDPS